MADTKMEPLEISWKSKKLPLVTTKREPPTRIARDPRFDPRCGEFDKKIFSRNYNFVQKLKMDDKASLTKELRDTADPERKKIIKLLIGRLNNQLKSQNEKKKLKVEEKVESLSLKYDQLKKNHKLQDHLKRQNQKQKRKQSS